MAVDEAGGHDLPLGVELPAAALGDAADRRDAVALDRDVGAIGREARAVDESSSSRGAGSARSDRPELGQGDDPGRRLLDVALGQQEAPVERAEELASVSIQLATFGPGSVGETTNVKRPFASAFICLRLSEQER
jgi:hypothetical protein